MPWPEQRNDQTRERILDSAARLFSLRGFDAVGIDELMADAGLTRGAFYHHFRSKSELYGQAIAHAARSGAAHFEALDGRGLDRLVEAYLRYGHAQGESPRCPLAFMAVDVSHREAAVRQSYTRTFGGFVERLQAALPDGAGNREQALQLAVTLIGGVTLARALDDAPLSEELLAACRCSALSQLEGQTGDGA